MKTTLTTRQCLDFATEALANSQILSRDANGAAIRLISFLEARGAVLSGEMRSAISVHVNNLQTGSGSISSPNFLCVAHLISAVRKLGLPLNTPIVYQRVEDGYFTELGWDQDRLRWDAEHETDYLAPSSYHVGKDRDGNVALCLNLMQPAADIRHLLGKPQELSAPNEDAATKLLPLHTDILARFAGSYIGEEEVVSIGSLEEARELACLHNKVVITSNLIHSGSPTVGALMDQLGHLPASTPVMCQRNYDEQFAKGWPQYVLTGPEGESAAYTDAYDWQVAMGTNGQKIATLNSWM